MLSKWTVCFRLHTNCTYPTNIILHIFFYILDIIPVLVGGERSIYIIIAVTIGSFFICIFFLLILPCHYYYYY